MAIIRKRKKTIYEADVSEADFAKGVIEWLKKDSWEVYQEVSIGYACSRADIVAVKEGMVWIIETKLSYNLNVMEQAYLWARYRAANFVSIAVLAAKKRRKNAVVFKFHNDTGIGLIEGRYNNFCKEWDISTINKPHFIRTDKNSNIKKVLTELHKNYCQAGTSKGGYLTPFRQSVEEIKKYIEKHPGKTLKEVIEGVGELHWANPTSAKICIAKYLNRGIIKGIRIETEGRKNKLYLERKNETAKNTA